MLRRRIIVLLTTGALQGCSTDLRTGPIQTPAGNKLQAGFVYNLPAAIISPTASLRIAGCPADDDAAAVIAANNAKKLPPPIKEATFSVSGDIAVEQVAGPPVLIDYRELADFLKTSSIGIERHPNLMLKSVNVSVEDESPALIANMAVVAADIALFTVNAPAATALTAAAASKNAATHNFAGGPRPRPTPDQVSYVACNPATTALLANRTAARTKKDTDTQSLDEANTALASLLRNSDPSFTQEEIRQIHQYRDHILALTASITDDTDAIKKIDEKLSLKLSVPVGRTASVDEILSANKLVLSAPLFQIQAFIASHFQMVHASVPSGLGPQFSSRPCTQVPYQTCGSVNSIETAVTQLAAVTVNGEADTVPKDGHTPSFAGLVPQAQKRRTGAVHPGEGIVYVEPAHYSFSLTEPTYPPNPVSPVTTLKSVKASVPQLGTYLVLPVHAGFGEKVELKATFNTDGSLATASFGRPSAGGKAASAMLAGLADKALATRDAVADRKLKLLKAEADRLTAQKSIIDARGALSPKADPLADLNAEIALANAKATLAEANLRLMVANSKLNGGS